MQFPMIISSVGLVATTLVLLPTALAGMIMPKDLSQLSIGGSEITQAYDCHTACGFVRIGTELDENHCDNTTWVGHLQDCLGCAKRFDVWKHYGNSVSEAAIGCNMDPTPAEADGSSSSALSSVVPADISGISDTVPTGTSWPGEDDEDNKGAAAETRASPFCMVLPWAIGFLSVVAGERLL